MQSILCYLIARILQMRNPKYKFFNVGIYFPCTADEQMLASISIVDIKSTLPFLTVHCSSPYFYIFTHAYSFFARNELFATWCLMRLEEEEQSIVTPG
jgi:hypothetical protein